MAALPAAIHQRLRDTEDVQLVIDELKEVTHHGGQRILDTILKCVGHYRDERYDSCLQLADCVIDLAWEMLNTGDWKEVPVIWRKIYTYATIYKAASNYYTGLFEQCILAADFGLLMGAPIMGNILDDIVSAASARLLSCKRINDDVLTAESNCTSTNDSHHQVKNSKRRKHITVNPHKQILQLDCPSLDYFRKHHFSKKEPVIITHAIDHWPALTDRKWSIQHLKEIAGHRTVPVEIGTRYTDESWTQKLMTISKFIDEFIIMEQDQGTGYLAQHQLFDQIPELKADICIPDYCCILDDSSEDADGTVLTNAWFGPQGTISPLHHDPYHNLFAQVMGRKYIRLYPEHESDNVYPFPTKLLSNTSQVDVEFPNFEKYPKFADAEYVECILNPGQLLYIPPRCWHYVRSLDISFSTSFWW